jgi:hypothetical protein
MYYPLSQITSNLYTNGNEFIYSDDKSLYTGHYWKTSTGKYYTGKTPQDTPTEEIIQLSNSSTEITIDPISDVPTFYNQDDISPVEYVNLTKPSSPSLLPTYSSNIPTQKDYQIGEYRRYFCKKTNEIIYLEINKDTYDKLVNKDSKILYQLYQPFNLPWQLTGDKSQVFITNKNITELTSKQQKLPMLSEYLRNDFTKYYK